MQIYFTCCEAVQSYLWLKTLIFSFVFGYVNDINITIIFKHRKIINISHTKDNIGPQHVFCHLNTFYGKMLKYYSLVYYKTVKKLEDSYFQFAGGQL